MTKLYAQNYGQEPRITEEQMVQFLQICLGRAGADSMITPREMLRDYMTVLNILMQNPEATFEQVVGSAVTLKTDQDDDVPTDGNGQKPTSGTSNGTLDSGSGNATPSGTGAKFRIDDIEF